MTWSITPSFCNIPYLFADLYKLCLLNKTTSNMMFYRTIFLVFLLYYFNVIECLRCAVDCPWVAFPMNVSVPFNVCRHEERDDAQCSVTVEIDFKKRIVNGQLYMQKRTTVATLRTETKFQLETDSIISTVWYTCTMSDYCDHDFLNELMTDKLEELNATAVQEKLINILYIPTPNTTDIQCSSNGSCPIDNFCQGDLVNIVTSQYNYTSINESLPCIPISANKNIIEINEVFLRFRDQLATMFVRCNTKDCTNDKTILDVYSIIRNDFILPLNYSILDTNISDITTTPLPSSASFLFSLHNLIFFFIFYFYFIK